MVDLEACAAAGVTVTNIRDYAVHTVPEHTFALILALRRSILAYRDSVARGRWQEAGQFCYFDYPVRDLAGSTLGVIGDGSIGQSVAELGKAFGMRTLFSAYKGTTGMGPLYTPFEELLRISDVITLHAPLMPSTRGMIGRAEFALMERRPLLINTARGGLVDEAALEEALTGGQIAGAGFDVATREPPPADHPLMRLLQLAELHPDAAYRLGERGGDPEPGRPADRQHRGVLGRRAAQRRDLVRGRGHVAGVTSATLDRVLASPSGVGISDPAPLLDAACAGSTPFFRLGASPKGVAHPTISASAKRRDPSPIHQPQHGDRA